MVTVDPGPFSLYITFTPSFRSVNEGTFHLLVAYVHQWFMHYCTPILAPSSPPLDFTATPTTSRSVYLTWSPPLPEDQNGDITGYIINVTVVETGERFQLFSETNSLTLHSLRPYTTYICVIAAVTSAGVGPFSTTFVVRTPEDGKEQCIYMCVFHYSLYANTSYT